MAQDEMPTFTILDPKQYLPLISQWYSGLGTAEELSIISGGLANSNYRLQTSRGTFLLKVCDEKGLAELLLQVRVLEAFRMQSAGAPGPFVHPFGDRVRSSDAITPAEDCVFVTDTPAPLRVIIYDFLSGSPGSVDTVTELTMSELANGLAKLHGLDVKSLGFEVPGYQLGVDVIQEFLDSRPDSTEPFELWLREQLPVFRPLMNDDSPYPRGLLHGDLFPDNAMFAADGTLVSIIDFEEICLGPLALDVAMTLVGCAYPHDNELSVALTRAFLSGYERQRVLTPAEREALPLFISFAALTIAFWRYRQFNVRHPTLGRQEAYKIMFERAKQATSLHLFDV